MKINVELVKFVCSVVDEDPLGELEGFKERMEKDVSGTSFDN